MGPTSSKSGLVDTSSHRQICAAADARTSWVRGLNCTSSGMRAMAVAVRPVKSSVMPTPSVADDTTGQCLSMSVTSGSGHLRRPYTSRCVAAKAT